MLRGDSTERWSRPSSCGIRKYTAGDKQPPPSPSATIPPKASDDAVKGLSHLKLKYLYVPNCNCSVFSEKEVPLQTELFARKIIPPTPLFFFLCPKSTDVFCKMGRGMLKLRTTC